MEHTWESENAYKALLRKPEGKRPLWIPRYKYENNIKINP
jgi:hypothetical protein